MLQAKAAFAGISVKDLDNTKDFYSTKLGLKLENEDMGLRYKLPGGGALFIYPKEDHAPATFTVLNFVVENIDSAVDELVKQGVSFERYDNGIKMDNKNIARGRAEGMGPDIAWFKDPSGNILSVLQDE